MTAPMAPMANADPAVINQKGPERAAWDTPAETALDACEFSNGSASSLNAMRSTPQSPGDERVTQIPIGKSTSRMNVPSNSSPCLHPQLRAREFTSIGAATPPKPSPRYAYPIARPRLRPNHLATNT